MESSGSEDKKQPRKPPTERESRAGSKRSAGSPKGGGIVPRRGVDRLPRANGAEPTREPCGGKAAARHRFYGSAAGGKCTATKEHCIYRERSDLAADGSRRVIQPPRGLRRQFASVASASPLGLWGVWGERPQREQPEDTARAARPQTRAPPARPQQPRARGGARQHGGWTQHGGPSARRTARGKPGNQPAAE